MYSGIRECAISYAEKHGGNVTNAEDIVRNVLDIILEQTLLSDEGVQFVDRFTFAKVIRAKKLGRNPSTGETYDIPEHLGIKLKVGRKFQKTLSESVKS